MENSFKTHVELQPEHRKVLARTLNRVLATSVDLHSQVKQAHWNIKGPHFFARHELFDKVAAHLEGMADTCAERISTMGGYAAGTARLSTELSMISEYDLHAKDGMDHIQALVKQYARFNGKMREMLAEEHITKDPVTEDMLIEFLRQSELDMWFLESHRAA